MITQIITQKIINAMLVSLLVAGVLYGKDSKTNSKTNTTKDINTSPAKSGLEKSIDSQPYLKPSTLLNANSANDTYPTLIDSNQLKEYSYFTYRYNTRLDKPNQIILDLLGGEAHTGITKGFYGGISFRYNGLINRFPLGFIASYIHQYNTYKNADSTNFNTYNALLGLYSHSFIGAHEIKIQLTQSFSTSQFPSNTTTTYQATNHTFTSQNRLQTATTTSFNAQYGYVFTLNNKGSFIEPLVGFNLYALFNTTNLGDNAPQIYTLNSSLDIGFRFQQFITQRFYWYISPMFKQDIGVIGSDRLMRLTTLNIDNTIDYSIQDSRYRSYGTLNAGFCVNISKYASLVLNVNGKMGSNVWHIGGNMGLNILF